MSTNDSQEPQQPPANVRARVLLRQGVRGKDVAHQLMQSGIDERQAESIVKNELESFRNRAGWLLAGGLLLAFVAFVASLRSYFQYLDLRHSYGYHIVYFYPLPFVIGLVFSIVGIAKLSKHRW